MMLITAVSIDSINSKKYLISVITTFHLKVGVKSTLEICEQKYTSENGHCLIL
jgi:hypothetical protein